MLNLLIIIIILSTFVNLSNPEVDQNIKLSENTVPSTKSDWIGSYNKVDFNYDYMNNLQPKHMPYANCNRNVSTQ